MRLIDKVSRRQSIGDDLQSGVSVPGGAGNGEAAEREDEEEPHRWLGDKGILFLCCVVGLMRFSLLLGYRSSRQKERELLPARRKKMR